MISTGANEPVAGTPGQLRQGAILPSISLYSFDVMA
jgi:hypothetical protein